MTELTKAEIMLNQVTKSNSLIRQLELCKNRPIPPLRLDLRPSTKSTIKAFQENVQGRIDQLTARLVLQLRYGLLDNATKKTPWLDIPALMNYEMETIYRRQGKHLNECTKAGPLSLSIRRSKTNGE